MRVYHELPSIKFLSLDAEVLKTLKHGNYLCIDLEGDVYLMGFYDGEFYLPGTEGFHLDGRPFILCGFVAIAEVPKVSREVVEALNFKYDSRIVYRESEE